MEIIVVGAGIGGLSAALSLSLAGHNVKVLETASALAEIGAGVQLTPNATKYFWKWGLGPDILANAVLPGSFNIHRDSDGEVLGQVPFQEFESRYGGPYLVIHRADIHRILHEHAVKAGAQLQVNSRVVKYDFEEGIVWLSSGEELQADLVVAVDGINSFARGSFLQDIGDGTEPTGWAAFRTTALVDAMKENPLTSKLLAEHNCRCWVGENTLVMIYLMKNGKMLNIVLSHLDNIDTTDWKSEQYDNEVAKLFGEWEPTIRALLTMKASEVSNWPVYQTKPLAKWTAKSGKFVLMGDAAHAMAFYLSMGVSMAVEDAEALTECLRVQERTQNSLALAMSVFEQVRKPRTEAVKKASLHAGNILQLPPGSEREVRDHFLKCDGLPVAQTSGNDFTFTKISYGIADQQIRDWCYGYDVVKEVQSKWDEVA